MPECEIDYIDDDYKNSSWDYMAEEDYNKLD